MTFRLRQKVSMNHRRGLLNPNLTRSSATSITCLSCFCPVSTSHADQSVSCCQTLQSAVILSEFGLNQEIGPSTTNVLSVQGEPGVPGPKVRSCLYARQSY